MNLVESIKNKAKQSLKKVVLPEGDEPRTVKAASILKQEGICEPILLGIAARVNQTAKNEGVNIDGIKIINPPDDHHFDDFVSTYFQKRQKKGMTQGEAYEIMKNTLFFGAMMVFKGQADGFVAGAINATGDVLRAALHIVGTAPGIKTVSSCFNMVLPNPIKGIANQIITMGDCAVIPYPTADQLADIALATAKTRAALIGDEPIVAMLSFSTMGSAKHEMVDLVLEALDKVKTANPELKVDGEMQADAALIESIGSRKAPQSAVAGKANTLVFPNLDAGNIGYKLVQRLAGAEAIGPVIQGLAKPCHDLSRGCSVDDIVSMAAIAAVQAQMG